MSQPALAPISSPDADDTTEDFFGFSPRRAPAIVALVLIGLVSIAILVRTFTSRSWFMSIASIVGALEVVGFGLRLGMFDNPNRGAFIAMQCLLIIPPSFLALVDYLALGKLVKLIKAAKPNEELGLRPGYLTWVFFGLELASLAAQGAGCESAVLCLSAYFTKAPVRLQTKFAAGVATGAGLSVGGDDEGPPTDSQAGQGLLIAGLAALAALISFFLVVIIYVHYSPKFKVPQAQGTINRIYAGLYLTIGVLLIRNIFRLVEFSTGWYGHIATTESYFYFLDTLMIFFWLLIVVPLHFGVYLKQLERELQLPIQPTKGAHSHNAVADGRGAGTQGAQNDLKQVDMV